MAHAIIADIGGTSMKLALVDQSGTVRARHVGPGANIRSAISPQGFASALTTGLDALVRDCEVDVDLVYLAVTGAGAAGRERIMNAASEAVRQTARIRPELRNAALELTDDITAAFLANTAGYDTGLLALSGTGAVQAAIASNRLVRRTDGLGWALGDVGSGTWLGQQVLRAVAADLDGTAQSTALTPRIVQMLAIPATTQALVAATDSMTPASWARYARPFADVVGILNSPTGTATEPDEVATDILRLAATHIARGIDVCAQELRSRGYCDPLPLVWAGGIATHCAALRDAILSRVHGVVPVASQEPIVGVAALATAALRRGAGI